MPQPANNLPDPLQAASAETGPNADEILSQLAGEEIDRLLAEAESPRSEPAAPAAVAKSANPSPPPAAAAPAEPAADSDLNKQLDDLFNALNEETIAPPAPATPAATATPAHPVVQPAAIERPQPLAVEQSQAAATPAQVSTSLENDVLAATELAAIPEPPAKKESAPVPKRESEPGEAPVSPFLRPLVWLSGLFPETAVDWMGKVAILTTLNAMAIFAYILMRRH